MYPKVSPMSNQITENLRVVRARLCAAARQAGRPPDAVRLIAVSKTVGRADVQTAYEAGLRDFAENRVQELLDKAPNLPADCQWHLIGPLQRNKVRHAVLAAAWIHSVDSLPLLERLERIAAEEGRCVSILLQVNVAEEESKHGFAVDAVRAALDQARTCRHAVCRGFMTMAPFDAGPATLRQVFGTLRTVRDRCVAEFGMELPELSMGMSGDFEAAIAEGATMIRVGTALFGPRRIPPIPVFGF